MPNLHDGLHFGLLSLKKFYQWGNHCAASWENITHEFVLGMRHIKGFLITPLKVPFVAGFLQKMPRRMVYLRWRIGGQIPSLQNNRNVANFMGQVEHCLAFSKLTGSRASFSADSDWRLIRKRSRTFMNRRVLCW